MPSLRCPRPVLPLLLSALATIAAVATMVAAKPALAENSVIKNGVSLVERNYLFYRELNSSRLLGEAFEYIEAKVPELRAWKAAGQAYLLSAGDCLLRAEVGDDAALSELIRPLEQAAALVRNCVADYDEEQLGAIDALMLRGLLSGLDPYSSLLDRRNKTEHTIQFRGKLAGIGARIGIRDNRLTLITVYPGSPASKAGLRDGDVVARINDLSATNILVSDAVERIRGEAGTTVILGIRRDGEDKIREIKVTRGLVNIPSVTAHMLGGDVVYAEISHFSQTTPQDFLTRVGELIDATAAAGIVIDLRRNSGGSMLGSSAIGDMFLTTGTLITTAGRDGRSAPGLTSRINASADTPFADLPVVFLLAPRTASGSELLAASLRNNDRALLLGERSYGKGTIQKTYRLGEEATLKLSVGRFLPNQHPIPGGGLTPDIEVLRYVFSENDPIIPTIRHRGELPFWLRTPDWVAVEPHKTRYRLAFAEELDPAPSQQLKGSESSAKYEAQGANPAGDSKTAEVDEHSDPTLAIAAEIVRKYGSTSAQRMLDAASPLLARRSREADRRLSEFLAAQGLDWTPGNRPAKTPALTASIDAGALIKSGSDNRLQITVTNSGSDTLYRVRGVLESSSRLLDGRPLLFGRLDPGSSRTWAVKVKASSAMRPGRIGAKVFLYDDEGEITRLGELILPVQGSPRPRIAYRYRVREGGEAGLLHLDLEVANRGEAGAQQLVVRAKNPLNSEFEIIDGQVDIEELPAGAIEHAELSVKLLNSLDHIPSITLALGVPDYSIFLSQELELTAGGDFGNWHESPHIEISGVQKSSEPGLYALVVDISDDRKLDSVRTRIDGETLYFVR